MRLIDLLLRAAPAGGVVMFSSLGLVDGDPLTVPEDLTVKLDQNTPSLGPVEVNGRLIDDGTTRTLTCSGMAIMDGGSVDVGNIDLNLTGAFPGLVDVTINGFTQKTIADHTARGIVVMPGGTLKINGSVPTSLWANITDHVAASATALPLPMGLGWPSGTDVVLAPTDFIHIGGSERFTLTSAAGVSTTLGAAVAKFRWGKLQYPVDTPVSTTLADGTTVTSGMSYTQGTFSAKKATADVPTVLDQRARVANLTRGATLRCPIDSDLTTNQHGPRIMWHAGAIVQIQGLRVKRGGTGKALAAYPLHAHVNGYNIATGAELTSVAGNFVRKCVIEDSNNRAITIHGTNDLEVTDNVMVGCKGHNVFLEDGSERRNTIKRNLAFDTVLMVGTEQLKAHDNGSASGYWITNVENYIEDNYGAGCNGPVAWVSLANAVFGLSHLAQMYTPYNEPSGSPMLLFKGFVAHSSVNGIRFNDGVSNEAGNTGGGSKYYGTSDFPSTDHVLFKNYGNYTNNVGQPDYRRWTLADGGGADFSGSTNNNGRSRDHLSIGWSLNSVNRLDLDTNFNLRCAFEPYHGTVTFSDMTVVNWPYQPIRYEGNFNQKSKGGGVQQGGGDFYINPGLDLVMETNSNLQCINAHMGPMVAPNHLDGVTTIGHHGWAVCSVWRDGQGYYGTAGKYMLPITPATGLVDDYWLTGAASVTDAVCPGFTGTVVAKSTTTRYFGMGREGTCRWGSDTLAPSGNPTLWGHTNFDGDHAPVTCTRQHPTTGATIGTPFAINRADSAAADGVGSNFVPFGGFTVQNGACYDIAFSAGGDTVAAPSVYLFIDIASAQSNGWQPGDFVMLNLPWNGAGTTATIWYGWTSAPNGPADAADETAHRAVMVNTPVASKAAVLADTTGKSYFYDTTAHKVWVRFTQPATLLNKHTVDVNGSARLYDVQRIQIRP